jgi:hypothetical protein
MEITIKYILPLCSVLSLFLSLSLWYLGFREEASYTAIWVPTLLCVANFLKANRKEE